MEVTMLRSLPIIVAAVAALAVAALAITSQPVKAASCTVVAAEGRGANEAKASARALKHLTFKINRWASKNGYTSVRAGHSSNICAEKGLLVHCTMSKKVCA
jgi:hypothetical protein